MSLLFLDFLIIHCFKINEKNKTACLGLRRFFIPKHNEVDFKLMYEEIKKERGESKRKVKSQYSRILSVGKEMNKKIKER